MHECVCVCVRVREIVCGKTKKKEKRTNSQLKSNQSVDKALSVLATTHGMFDRCKTAEGGKMFWQFFEPGRLNLCKGELTNSLVRPASC